MDEKRNEIEGNQVVGIFVSNSMYQLHVPLGISGIKTLIFCFSGNFFTGDGVTRRSGIL
jgi:hypothetical protein